MTPLVSLEQFRREMQLQPFHYYGLADSVYTPVTTTCNDLIHEYAWQGQDMAGRDDIRRALDKAEDKLRDYLTYSIAPHFVTDTLIMPRFRDRRLNRIGYSDATGRWLDVQLNEKKVIACGLETRTLIGTVQTSDLSLVYTDDDGDGLIDTFTATIATTVTDVTQIALYFAVGDRLDGSAVGERWRITPIYVAINLGVAVIKGRAWQLVRPILYEGVGSYFADPTYAVDPTNTGNYVSSLEVYRYYCDPTGTTTDTAQAMLIWETQPYPFWTTTPVDNSLDPAAQAYAIARCALRDPENGVIGIGESLYDASTGNWRAQNLTSARPPDRIVVRYQAGDPLVNAQIKANWVTVVSRLAAAELGRRVSLCPERSKELSYWQIDRAFAGNATEEKFTPDAGDLSNPFGTRNGHIYAWHEVQSKRLLTAVLA